MSKVYLLFLLLLPFSMIGSQCSLLYAAPRETVASLKKKQRQAKANIELTNKLLKENEQTKKNHERDIILLKRKINEREKLIGAMKEEVTLLDSSLTTLTNERVALEENLEEQKAEYARLLYHGYFHRSRSQTALFVLSSESMTQALRRGRYVQQYSDYRKRQALRVRLLADSLARKETELAQVKKEKQQTLTGKQIETEKLQKNQTHHEQLVKDLSAKKTELQQRLARQQSQANALNKQIDKMIAEEIARAERERKAKEERLRKAANKKKGANATTPATAANKPTETSAPLSSEASLVQGGFERNKGRMPWPVNGVITGRFGIHPHPVLDHVTVNNKGIYIQGTAGSDACVIYDGEVTQIFAIPGNNNAIIVKHGNYRSVYANVTTQYVKVGDKVKARQKLGKIYVDTERGNETVLYLMLYRGTELQDPETWLIKK